MNNYKKLKKKILEQSKQKFNRLHTQPKKYCNKCENYKYMASRRGTVCYDCMDNPCRARFFREGMKK